MGILTKGGTIMKNFGDDDSWDCETLMQTHPQEAANEQGKKQQPFHETIASWLSKNSHLEYSVPSAKFFAKFPMTESKILHQI